MLLYPIAGALFLLWVFGLIIHVGGIYLHLLLVAAVVLAMIRSVQMLNASTPENVP